MATHSQRKAVKQFRQRRRRAGVVRFEVAAPEQDKELMRSIARRLIETGAQTEQLRTELRRLLSGEEQASIGGILRALRSGPLFDDDLDFSRDRSPDRTVDL